MDRLALLIVAVVFTAFGRSLDPQWRRDLRWKLARLVAGEPLRGEWWEQRIRRDVRDRLRQG